MQGDVVATLPEVFEPGDAFDPVLGGALGREERVVTHHLHVKPQRPLGDGQAHAAKADDAQRLAAELGAGELRAIPTARLEAVIRLGHVPGEGQHEGHRVFGGRNGIPARCVHYHDPMTGRGGHVDIVDTHSRADDDFQSRLILQDLGRQLRTRPDHDPVGVGQGGTQHRWIELRVHDHLEVRLGTQDRQPFLSQFVRDQHAMHHNSAPLVAIGLEWRARGRNVRETISATSGNLSVLCVERPRLDQETLDPTVRVGINPQTLRVTGSDAERRRKCVPTRKADDD